MADGSGAPAATPNPFGQQQQPMQQQPFGSGQGQMPNFSVSTPDNVARPGGWLGGGSGGQQQQPLGMNPFSSVNSTTQQDMMGRGGSGMPFGQRLGQLGFGGSGGQFQPDPVTVSSEYPTQSFGDMQNRVQQPTNRGQFEIYTPQHYQQQQPQQPLSFDDYYKVPQQRTQQAYRIGEKEAEYQQYRDNFGKPSGMQVAQPPPMQNAFQPQQPSFMQDPEYQGYQTQMQDLNRQMNEYMQKAPMYQQLQDLQGKMAPFQQRYYQQQQDMQRMQQPLNQQRYDPIQAERAYYERMASQRQQPMQQRQFNPYQQQQQYRQPAGIQGLMGMLGGKNRMQQAQPRMSMDMPQARPAVMPRSFGREQRYAMPSRDYSSIGSVGAARPADPAVAAEAPVVNSAIDYFPNSW